jgi:hypothetical protein
VNLRRRDANECQLRRARHRRHDFRSRGSIGSAVLSRCTVRPKRSHRSLSQTYETVPVGRDFVGSAAPPTSRLAGRSPSPQPSHRILVDRRYRSNTESECPMRARPPGVYIDPAAADTTRILPTKPLMLPPAAQSAATSAVDRSPGTAATSVLGSGCVGCPFGHPSLAQAKIRDSCAPTTMR